MELNELAEIVQTMIVLHDYPGYDVRSLELGLPDAAKNSHNKVFASALGHESVYVRLAALRWFKERPGVAKSAIKPIMGLLDHPDEWVRREAAQTIERISKPPEEVAVRIAHLLKDPDVEVRKAAAKAIGKIYGRAINGAVKNNEVLQSLQEAAEDDDAGVRWKAQKALRQIGEYA